MFSSQTYSKWLMFIAVAASAVAVFLVIDVKLNNSFGFSYQYELRDLSQEFKDLPNRVGRINTKALSDYSSRLEDLDDRAVILHRDFLAVVGILCGTALLFLIATLLSPEGTLVQTVRRMPLFRNGRAPNEKRSAGYESVALSQAVSDLKEATHGIKSALLERDGSPEATAAAKLRSRDADSSFNNVVDFYSETCVMGKEVTNVNDRLESSINKIIAASSTCHNNAVAASGTRFEWNTLMSQRIPTPLSETVAATCPASLISMEAITVPKSSVNLMAFDKRLFTTRRRAVGLPLIVPSMSGARFR